MNESKHIEGLKDAPVCPRCYTPFIRLVWPKTVVDKLAQMLYLYPFRCQLCALYFRKLRWGRFYKPQLRDIRHYERLRTVVPVQYVTSLVEGRGNTIDLSIKGCGMHIGHHLVKGTHMRLFLDTSEYPDRVEIKDAVVRWSLANTCGVEFTDMTVESWKTLQTIMEDHWVKMSARGDRSWEAMPSV